MESSMDTTFFLIVGTVTLVIVGAEWAMWRLFRRRFQGLHFPHEADASSAPFFTLGRLRVFIVLHTLYMITVLFFLFFPRW
jgi:hypothetical protein